MIASPMFTNPQENAETPKNLTLAEFFGVGKYRFKRIKPSSFAHVVIDVQRVFCDPNLSPGGRHPPFGTPHTVEIASKIATIMPHFRAANINTCVVIYAAHEGYEGELYKVKSEDSDIIIRKLGDAALWGRDSIPEGWREPGMDDIHDELQKRNIKNLLVSGFNASACLSSNVYCALKKKYKVALLEDCIGENKGNENYIPQYIEQMVQIGAHVTTSNKALDFLQTLQNR